MLTLGYYTQMKLRNYFYYCMIMLLVSCKGREHDPLAFVPPVFPETKQVKVTVLNNDFLFRMAYKMADLGDYLILSDYDVQGVIQIFDKKTGDHVRSFGSVGRGPGEFIINPIIQVNEDRSVLYAYEGVNGQNRLRGYYINDVLHKSAPYPFMEQPVSLSIKDGNQYPGIASNFLFWRDKRLFFSSVNHRMELHDSAGKVLSLYDRFPECAKPSETDSSIFRTSYLGAPVALKPDMSRFVVASDLGCIVEIFRVVESNRIEKVTEKRFFRPEYKIIQNAIIHPIDRKTIAGITKLSVTNSQIYARYIGSVYVEGLGHENLNQIAVFDWEGEPICLYVLDWNIYNFVVDAQQNRCYLVGTDAGGEVQLGFFDL